MPCLKSENDSLREKQQENTSDESREDLRSLSVRTPTTSIEVEHQNPELEDS